MILLALAGFQAYAQRFTISPDGMSYLDLSDAVVNGRWSELLNVYWSPLYPALIGIARAISGAGPATEIGVVHAVNFACFVAMLAAFDYMLGAVRAIASSTRGSVLGGSWGLAGAFVLFGCFALTMIPLELTTPDLLSGAAVFVAFGALLRLRGSEEHIWRNAAVLGVALGVGALAKSFMVPWALVCLGTLASAMRQRRWKTVAVSAGVWLAIVLPWTVALSRVAGHPTFGDTGRLTYVWYVNMEDAPSRGGVPPGTRTARTEMILPGVGVTGAAPGSDPMWYDPARWNAVLHPRFSLSQQLGTLGVFQRFYVQNLTPLLFLFLLIACAPRGTRRVAWWGGWIVYVPALAGMLAYAMVIVTARYVMPFALSGTLVLLATLPRPRRMLPLLALFGVAVPIALEALSPQTILGLALITSVLGGMLAGAVLRVRSRVAWGILVVAALVVTRVIFPPFAPTLLRLGAVSLAIGLWFASRAAVRNRRTVDFAQRTLGAMGLLLLITLLLRLQLRFNQDLDARDRGASGRWGNVQWNIARELAAHGITPGTRIALVGPHAESYWVRTARLHIAANVPKPRAAAFWSLPSAAQDSLLAEFAAAGATVAIASIGPEHGSPDSRWIPIRFNGWIRPLSPATR